MRPVPSRIPLSKKTNAALLKKIKLIYKATNQKELAETIYTSARHARWFSVIVSNLKAISGPGERCMYCSGNESSQVEHYRPKANHPKKAMSYRNFLWVCGQCNHNKLNFFPGGPKRIINPIDEDIWDFFFIDDYGFLSAVWRDELGTIDPRAESTIKICGLDREPLEIGRQDRIREISTAIKDSMRLHSLGDLTLDDLRSRLAIWKQSSFHPDVTSFFLIGPGKSTSPFLEFFELIEP